MLNDFHHSTAKSKSKTSPYMDQLKMCWLRLRFGIFVPKKKNFWFKKKRRRSLSPYLLITNWIPLGQWLIWWWSLEMENDTVDISFIFKTPLEFMTMDLFTLNWVWGQLCILLLLLVHVRLPSHFFRLCLNFFCFFHFRQSILLSIFHFDKFVPKTFTYQKLKPKIL